MNKVAMVNRRKNDTPGKQINLSWPLDSLHHFPCIQEPFLFLCHNGLLYNVLTSIDTTHTHTDTHTHTHTQTLHHLCGKTLSFQYTLPCPLYSLLFCSQSDNADTNKCFKKRGGWIMSERSSFAKFLMKYI